MKRSIALAMALAVAGPVWAAEVTVKNDSLVDFGTGTIQAGFVAGEKAASWLTSPCDGNIVAVQVFWTSLFGGTPFSLQDSIVIHRSGAFPIPGAVAEEILGPVLNDGFLNEYRYLDENSTIPLIVPVASNETFVVAFTFAEAPDAGLGPSIVNDIDGAQPNRNAIYADIAGTFVWFSNTDLGVNGDWVIRAVVDCTSGGSQADVGIAMSASAAEYVPGGPLGYTITIDNAGPAASPTTTIIDTFPAAYTNITWTCTPAGGATCTASGSGGTLAQIVNLPAGASVTYAVSGTVQAGTTGTLTNSATVVAGGVTDPDQSNNSVSLDLEPAAVVLQADLVIEIDSDDATYVPGGEVTWIVSARNDGPDGANASVNGTLPPGFSASTWSCTASGGASCSASGTGALSDVVALPTDAVATYTVTGTVAAEAAGPLSVAASIEVSAPVLDPTPGNNADKIAFEPDPAADDMIFADGFETDARPLRVGPLRPQPALAIGTR